MRDNAVGDLTFEALYAAHYQAIAGYVMRRVAAGEADDVIAQVFSVAWRRFGQVPPPPFDRPWLFGVARNTVADHQRAERRRFHLHARLRSDAALRDEQATATQDTTSERVRAAIGALRPVDREALQLVLWDELSHAEAAAVLGCSPNAFELRYRRARSAVRAAVLAMHAADPPGKERRPAEQQRTTPS